MKQTKTVTFPNGKKHTYTKYKTSKYWERTVGPENARRKIRLHADIITGEKLAGSGKDVHHKNHNTKKNLSLMKKEKHTAIGKNALKESVLQSFVEEFVDMKKMSTKMGDVTISIYRDPAKKEIKEALEETNDHRSKEKERSVRFVIDLFNKNIYIWNSFLLHHYAAKLLQFPYNFGQDVINDRYIYGIALVSPDFKLRVQSPFILTNKKFFKKNKIEYFSL